MKVTTKMRPADERPEEDDDRRVVERAQAGDPEAFGELFVRHVTSVRRLLISVLGPSGDLDDLVQDVFVQVHRSLPRFRSEARLGTWLHRVTVNVAMSYLRRRRGRQALTEPVALERRPGSTANDVHDRFVAKEMVRRLYKIMDSLSRKRRVAFALFELQGHSIAESAEIAGVSAPVMKSRIFFARREIVKKAGQDPYLGPFLKELER